MVGFLYFSKQNEERIFSFGEQMGNNTKIFPFWGTKQAEEFHHSPACFFMHSFV